MKKKYLNNWVQKYRKFTYENLIFVVKREQKQKFQKYIYKHLLGISK